MMFGQSCNSSLPMGVGMFPPGQVNSMGFPPMGGVFGPTPAGFPSSGQARGPFGFGGGCGGTAIPCSMPDIPPQARERKQRALPCEVQRKKVDVTVPRYTSLATLPISAQDTTDPQETVDSSSYDENFDTITLALGTKPGSQKPPKMLVTLKTPKVVSANLCVNNVGTQVTYKDFENRHSHLKGRHSGASKKSSGSKRSRGSRKSGGKKGSEKKGTKKKGK